VLDPADVTPAIKDCDIMSPLVLVSFPRTTFSYSVPTAEPMSDASSIVRSFPTIPLIPDEPKSNIFTRPFWKEARRR
jgi:hypothetical protein